VTELNGTGGRNHSNVYAAGELLSTYDRSGLHFELSDWQGTKRVQTDPLGQVEESCVSLPFGDGLSCTATALASSDDATEHHFTGKEHDAESGNEYFDARYLSSTLGRFLTPDWAAKPTSVPYASFGDPQTLNLYSYVENGPLNRVDADGHANAKLPIGYESIDDFANPSCGPHYSGGDPCWASNQGLSEAIDEANYLAQVQQASASTGNTAAQPAQAQAQQKGPTTSVVVHAYKWWQIGSKIKNWWNEGSQLHREFKEMKAWGNAAHRDRETLLNADPLFEHMSQSGSACGESCDLVHARWVYETAVYAQGMAQIAKDMIHDTDSFGLPESRLGEFAVGQMRDLQSGIEDRSISDSVREAEQNYVDALQAAQ